MNKEDYSEIEVFEKYLSLINLDKISFENNDLKIKDLKLDDGTYCIFCWDKKDFYHLVAIQGNILYDKRESTLELFPISIYKLNIL